MNYKIIVKPEAELDATVSALWYNEQREGLGYEFLEALEKDIDKIKTNPQLCAVKYKQTRVALVRRFSYGIHYKIETDKIFILAILHTSRNPRIWEERQ